MANKISTTTAEHADLEDLIAITVAATEPHILSRFLYDPVYFRPDVANRCQAESLRQSLGQRFTNPTNRCAIVKAVSTASNGSEEGDGKEEIVGWCLVRWEDGKVPPTKIMITEGRKEGVEDFLSDYMKTATEKWRAMTGGKEHVVIGALHVKPGCQGQGIGRKLVDHVCKEYELDDAPLYLRTVAASEKFYQRLGFVTVDSTDSDLSKWAGEGRGFGYHRSPLMVKWPKA